MATPLLPSDSYYDLGQFHRGVTTSSPEAQLWFDRGLTWTYAFNHWEAVRCFEEAVNHDPSCSMVYWGLAYAAGPNYNKPWESFDPVDLKASRKKAYDAARKAKDNIAQGTPSEQALVEAIQFRYQDDKPGGDHVKWNADFIVAMEKVYRRFKDDPDVAAVYADSMMNLTPWHLWNLKTGKQADGARTLDAKAILDRALSSRDNWYHPGLLHLYIHLMEMSPTPEVALNPADRLRSLIPDAGHLHHMPSHLDVLIGDYRRAISSNAEALRADKRYYARTSGNNSYMAYVFHTYHSLIYAAMFAGQFTVAIDTTAEMEAFLPESLLRVESPPMADWVETFMSVRAHVLVRFGRWQDILDLKIPQDQKLYATTVATFHYAKAIAYAATSRLDDAETHRQHFRDAVQRIPPTRLNFPNKVSDCMDVAAAMLDGEIAYRRGDFDSAWRHLGESVSRDDSLVYAEPWGWMQPTRHAFAALLLEQGHVDRAAALYRADLGLDNTLARARHHPNNIWALRGYYECLTRLNKTAEAEGLAGQLRLAQAVAEVEVKSSCYCRNGQV